MNSSSKLLEEDIKFLFDEVFQKAFDCLTEKLILFPIIVSLNWALPFEVMWDANGVALGVVLGKNQEKILYPIYNAIKALNPAHMDYTTEQVLPIFVFLLDKFWSYLIGMKVIVHIYHLAIRYLMAKKVSNKRLSRLVILI